MENIVHCSECNSENLENSVYCCQCGQPMRRGVPVRLRKGQWLTIVAFSLILSSIMTVCLHYVFSHSPKKSGIGKLTVIETGDSQTLPEKAGDISVKTGRVEQSESGKFSQSPAEEQQTYVVEPLVLGTVSIISPEGVTVNEFSAVVVNGSWLALPTRLCIGGNKWFLKVGNEKEIPIEGGLWGIGDTVGLWKLGEGKKYSGPSLATWNQEEGVRFLSIKTGSLYEPMFMIPTGMQGVFIYSSLSAPTDPGVYIQSGKVVGWSFGELMPGAYMWVLGSGADLLYENYVDDFYNETFAGGREEYFSNILANRQSISPQRQLQMFAEAVRRPEKLMSEYVPRYLRAENVYPIISGLIDQILKQESYSYVAILAEEPLLWEMGSPAIIKDVAFAIQKVYGTYAALTFLEARGEEILKGIEGEAFQPLEYHLELYLDLIRKDVDNGEIVRGWQNYNRSQLRFKDSAELHLLGVELALAEGDWEEAERLLYQMDYPRKFSDRVTLLANRISDLKGFENKIVIRFQPNSHEIPVKTTINETAGQDFLVDTGASFVTIPYSTVESLGLENEVSHHRQEIQTAGGPVYANAVTLSSIELQGWIVSDVKAFIIDIPNRPGLGLLGLNFLGRFNIDMQTDTGILTLEPK